MLTAHVSELIKNKRVLILGFGREGRSTYALLKKAGGYKKLAIADLNPVTDVQEQTFCGEDYQKSIENFDIVFKSPGVVLENFEHKEKITSQTDEIINCFKERMIGITGTKGKSTTTSLIYHVLKECDKKPVLMGNIGIPAFEASENIGKDNLLVYELSCHQLEFARKSPHTGVLLNIYPEHLDHYGTFERYRHAKENMYRNMTENDFLVCSMEFMPEAFVGDSVAVSMTNKEADFFVTEDAIYEKGTVIAENVDCNIFGVHNMYNIAVAYAVCKKQGVEREGFFEALKSYNPLPHRLEKFLEHKGVRYFDDSISTIPETAIKALTSVKNVGTIVLGGMDRNIDLNTLIEFLIENPVKNVVLLPDTGKIIYEKLKDVYKYNLYLVDNLKSAAKKCVEVTKTGEACILSPAAASYGFFKNFEERGDCFKKYILELVN